MVDITVVHHLKDGNFVPRCAEKWLDDIEVKTYAVAIIHLAHRSGYQAVNPCEIMDFPAEAVRRICAAVVSTKGYSPEGTAAVAVATWMAAKRVNSVSHPTSKKYHEEQNKKNKHRKNKDKKK